MAKQNDDVVLPNGFDYRAFLSYRTADSKQAEWLHRKLEEYRVPRSLVGSDGDFGKVPKRVGRLFRDRDEARTAADIESLIAEHLARSQHLIVLCSPRAVEPGSWVPREIQIFRQRRPKGEIHAVIGDGEPPACFPPELLSTETDGTQAVPLAADLRPKRKGGGDGKRKAVAKIVASLLGIPFDALWRRERRRLRLRRLITALGIGLLFAVIFGILNVAAAMREVDRSLGVSTEAVRAHRWDLAALAAADAERRGLRLGPLRSEQAGQRLLDLRGDARTTSILLGHQKGLTSVLLDPEASRAFTSALDGRILAWNLEESSSGPIDPRQIFKLRGQARDLQMSIYDGRLLVYAGSKLVVLDANDPSAAIELDLGAKIRTVRFVDGGRSIAVGDEDGRVHLLSADLVDRRTVLFTSGAAIESAATTVQGKRLVVGDADGSLYAIEFESERPNHRILVNPEGEPAEHLTFTSTGAVVVASMGDSVTLYDWATGEAEIWFTLRDDQIFFSDVAPSGAWGLSLLTGDVLALWSPSDGELVAELTPSGCGPEDVFVYGCRTSIARFLIANEGSSERILAGYWDGSMRVWSTDGTELATIRGHVARISALATSTDGKTLLSASEDRTARLWSLGRPDPRSMSGVLDRFCAETDPALLAMSDLVLGSRFNFNSTYDSSVVDPAIFVDMAGEFVFESPCP